MKILSALSLSILSFYFSTAQAPVTGAGTKILPALTGGQPRVISGQAAHNENATLRFEANKGQWPSQVHYKSDLGGGRRVFLEGDRFTFVMYDQQRLYSLHQEDKEMKRDLSQETIKAHAYQMKFINARVATPVTGLNIKNFHVNYFLGNDPSRWASDVPVYEGVMYKDLYEGIDLHVYAQDRQFKYDYLISAGADASNIRVEFEGVESLLLRNSTLYIHTSVGEVVETIPYSYQVINGEQKSVACEYKLNKTGTGITFSFPEGYNKNFPPVIDPVVKASTYSGSSADTYGHCATFDPAGNIYAGGRTFSQGYPTTVGAYQLVFGGSVDMSVSKMNPGGTTLIYSTYLGGSSSDYPHSMYVHNDQLFVYGTTTSTNFPVTTGCYDNSSNGMSDMVITKFNSSGSSILGSTYVGGTLNDGLNNAASFNYGDTYRGEIVVNANGDAYIIGTTNSSDFPVSSGAFDGSHNGSQDAVVFKMNNNLTTLSWATFLGGADDEAGCSIRVNPLGDVFVVGLTEGNGFPSSSSAINSTYVGGAYDGFVTKLSSSGSTLLGSTFIGTSQLDIIYFVDLDYNGDVYVYGLSTGSMPISQNVYSNPGSQTFLMKMNSGLTTVVYSTALGNGQHTPFSPCAFMVDLCQNAYLCGWGNTINYPISSNAVQSTTDYNDFHLMVIQANAAGLAYGTFYGAPSTGEHVDGGTSRFDPNGLVYQAVCECGNQFPTLPNSISTVNNSANCDIAVFKIDFELICNPLMTQTTICYGSVATLTLLNVQNLTNVSYSMNPGGFISSTNSFTVSPTSTSSYTLYVTGTNYLNATVTNSGVANVSVTAQPVVSPTFTQSSCITPTNAFNLGLGFLPPVTNLTHTVSWSAVPAGILSNAAVSATGGILPGPYVATITASNGCKVVTAFTMDPIPEPLVLTVVGPTLITCVQPFLNLSITPSNHSYTWTSSAANFTGSSAVLSGTNAGQWIIYGENLISGCTGSISFVVSQNTTVVTSTLTPMTQVINCSQGSVATVTATGSPSINSTHYWMSAFGGTLTTNTYPSVISQYPPGTHTHVLVNNVNGCSVTKIFTITSSSGHPTYSVTSPQNFTLGCNSRSVITIDIINAQTTPPGSPVTYTILAPSSNPVYVPAPKSTFTNVTEPGTYTIITKDNNNLCETKIQISVLSNTFAPPFKVAVPRDILTCDYPSVGLRGSSTNTNVSFLWTFPGTPGSLPSDSIRVNITTNPTNSLIANYTLAITDNNNTCRTTTVIPMLQNTFKPVAVISGDKPLTCKSPSLTLTNISISTIPAQFGGPGAAIGYLWSGPSPQKPSQISTTYFAVTPGTYTLMVKDSKNGCTAVTTRTVDDFMDYPIVNRPEAPAPFIFDCAAVGATIHPTISSPTTGLTYSWQTVASASISSLDKYETVVNKVGTYNVIVTNPANGCSTSGMVEVITGNLFADFKPDPAQGFAPLTVTFINNSTSSSTLTGKLGIISHWSFGNGSIAGPIAATVNPSNVYTQPGMYRITLFVNKGGCKDTAVRLVDVKLPSFLEIPNVFTPNDDGTNDEFFVKAANLTEISAIIYDRWGHLVYELTSTTGNILWNGKNQLGDKVAEGTYFYVIKAAGLDGQSYEQNGTISLIR